MPGPLRAKADHRTPPPLPGIPATGSPIELGSWRYRRPVHGAGPGVIRLELDALTLARLDRPDSLADLRLVQDGRQLPWLLTDQRPLRGIAPRVNADPDPKRPGVSRWSLVLPVDGLPAVTLGAGSPDPLFSRELILRGRPPGSLGSQPSAILGQATWTRKPDSDPAGRRLAIALHGMRLPEALTLETDNRDNPPLRLDEVEVRFDAPVIAARIPGRGPVFLYYGNPRSEAPAYDLALVRSELFAADAAPATLGPEEALHPAARREPGAGSPWLWVSLALVVGLLLVVVARLLPTHGGDPPTAQ